MAQSRQAKCECNMGFFILAIVLMTLGIYSIAGGFIGQFNRGEMSTVIAWYFVGLLFMGIGKMAKWKSHGMCKVHNMR